MKDLDMVIETEKSKGDYVKELVLLARQKKLTYAEVGRHLEPAEMDKDEMEEIYESLMSKGIEIVSEEGPDDFALVEIHAEAH